jgi:putrescine transport system permease protein
MTRVFATPTGAVLGLGLVFLYLPLAMVIAYSFNASRLVTVWTGFSTEWYGALLADEQILRAAVNSLVVALLAATLALIVGTAAGYAFARFGRFPARAALAGTVAAPLVLPDVIAGLSLLLLFVALEQTFAWMPGRGIFTIVLAHASFAMPYVAIIVQARLAGMTPDLEEAAADLGARPFTVFRSITLPLLRPALVSGWLLAFVLSLDDLVIASFVSGPQSTTLPMVVFSSIRLGVSPKINALATILIIATLVILALAAWAGRGLLKTKPPAN